MDLPKADCDPKLNAKKTYIYKIYNHIMCHNSQSTCKVLLLFNWMADKIVTA